MNETTRLLGMKHLILVSYVCRVCHDDMARSLAIGENDVNESPYSSLARLATHSFSSIRSPFKREMIAVNDRYLPFTSQNSAQNSSLVPSQ